MPDNFRCLHDVSYVSQKFQAQKRRGAHPKILAKQQCPRVHNAQHNCSSTLILKLGNPNNGLKDIPMFYKYKKKKLKKKSSTSYRIQKDYVNNI